MIDPVPCSTSLSNREALQDTHTAGGGSPPNSEIPAMSHSASPLLTQAGQPGTLAFLKYNRENLELSVGDREQKFSCRHLCPEESRRKTEYRGLCWQSGLAWKLRVKHTVVFTSQGKCSKRSRAWRTGGGGKAGMEGAGTALLQPQTTGVNARWLFMV